MSLELWGPTFTSNPKVERGMLGESNKEEGKGRNCKCKEIMKKRVVEFCPFAARGCNVL